MLNKLGPGIIASRKFILVMLILAVAASALGIVFVLKDGRANSNMLDFLGDGTDTRKGLDFLEAEFGIKGDAMFVVQADEDDGELYSILEDFAARDGVSRLIWYGTLQKTEEAFEPYLSFLEILGLSKDDFIDVNSLASFLKQPAGDTDGKHNFVVLMMLEHSPSSKEAFAVLDEIETALNPRPVAFAGMTDTAKTVMRDSLEELPTYLFWGILAVLAILILTTTSYIEPVIVLVTLGAAILVNLGTGYFFPGLSVVGYAASAVLQLGCTLDFAVIFIHIYKEKRALFEPREAVKEAFPRGSRWILVSSFITMGGLVGLCFIGLDLGKDLAFSLIKGIFCSMLTATIALPSLLFVLDGAAKKTAHKRIININYEKPGRTVARQRALIVGLAMSVFIAALIARGYTDITYFKIYKEKESVSSLERTASMLANQLIIAVPLIPDQGTQAEFVAEIKAIQSVDQVMGVFSALKIRAEAVEVLLETTELLNTPELSAFFAKTGDGKYYTLCSVVLKGGAEDEGSVGYYGKMREVCGKYFNDSYGFGVITGVADMSATVKSEFWIVTAASAAIVFIMLLFLLRSVRKAAFLITLIELGIWVNLAINALFNIPLNFLIYIMLPAVQLSCTINYALYVCLKYDEIKKTVTDSETAAAITVKESASPVLTGMSLLAATCLAVYFSSRNLIIKDISLLLARGGIIGGVFSLTAVPALLTYYKQSRYPRFIKKLLRIE